MVFSATNSPKNFNSQSNSIVPVQFLSAKAIGTNFVMSFRTATGVNGSAGPTYAVESKTSLTDPLWAGVTSVAGNGTIKFVTNRTTSASSKVFRLRSP